MQLAELNFARLKHDLEDPRVAGFVNNVDRVNAIADRSDGFVWRLKHDSNNAIAIQAFDDPRVIVNISVWQSIQTLENFVWHTVHKQFFNSRPKWFETMEKKRFAMWWIEDGVFPGVEEAMLRLQHLQKYGPSDYAFGWDSLPQVQMWKQAQRGDRNSINPDKDGEVTEKMMMEAAE